MFVEVKFIDRGLLETEKVEITEEQKKRILEILDCECSDIDKLREKTIAALAKQVELLDQCDNALAAQITDMKFRVLNKTLRTLDSI